MQAGQGFPQLDSDFWAIDSKQDDYLYLKNSEWKRRSEKKVGNLRKVFEPQPGINS
jgi:hypothetical protein